MWKGKKECGLSANVVNYKFWNRKEFPVLDAASATETEPVKRAGDGARCKRENSHLCKKVRDLDFYSLKKMKKKQRAQQDAFSNHSN